MRRKAYFVVKDKHTGKVVRQHNASELSVEARYVLEKKLLSEMDTQNFELEYVGAEDRT